MLDHQTTLTRFVHQTRGLERSEEALWFGFENDHPGLGFAAPQTSRETRTLKMLRYTWTLKISRQIQIPKTSRQTLASKTSRLGRDGKPIRASRTHEPWSLLHSSVHGKGPPYSGTKPRIPRLADRLTSGPSSPLSPPKTLCRSCT